MPCVLLFGGYAALGRTPGARMETAAAGLEVGAGAAESAAQVGGSDVLQTMAACRFDTSAMHLGVVRCGSLGVADDLAACCRSIPLDEGNQHDDPLAPGPRLRAAADTSATVGIPAVYA